MSIYLYVHVPIIIYTYIALLNKCSPSLRRSQTFRRKLRSFQKFWSHLLQGLSQNPESWLSEFMGASKKKSYAMSSLGALDALQKIVDPVGHHSTKETIPWVVTNCMVLLAMWDLAVLRRCSIEKSWFRVATNRFKSCCLFWWNSKKYQFVVILEPILRFERVEKSQLLSPLAQKEFVKVDDCIPWNPKIGFRVNGCLDCVVETCYREVAKWSKDHYFQRSVFFFFWIWQNSQRASVQ